nr:uncharacterized protein LOC112544793 [Pelodiscus sinensis]|eukprot:XP_025037443.1 uncharacterized protein LOC112544793 [Pelodiscus sinensis]
MPGTLLVWARKGHHPHTVPQVRAKVKELRQGHIRAREHSSRSGETAHRCAYYEDLDWILGAGKPLPPERLVDSGLETPVQQWPQLQADDQELQKEEEEEDGTRSTLEQDAYTQQASQTTSDTGEGTSAGPADQEGGTTPSPHPDCCREPVGTGARTWTCSGCRTHLTGGWRQSSAGTCWRNLPSSTLRFVLRSGRPWPSPVLRLVLPSPQPLLSPASAIPDPGTAPPPAQSPTVPAHVRSRVREGLCSQSARGSSSRQHPQP